MGKTPLFALFSALYLGVAIGGNTAMFRVVDSVLLRSVPFEQPDRLILVRDRFSGPGSDPVSFGASPFNFLARRSLAELQGNGALQATDFSLTGAGAPEHIAGARVSSDFFPTLGVAPALGRGFLAEEERPGAHRVALISHELWSRRFGSDPALVNQTLILDGEPHVAVGVLPAEFHFPFVEADVWVPLALDPADPSLPQRKFHQLTTVARLAPGISVQRARTGLQTLASRLARDFPDTHEGWGVEALSIQEHREGGLRPRLIALQLAAAFVLLIVCANLSNLLLVRAERRSGELAVRMALGATRSDLARLLLAESLTLALLGGVLGVLLASGFVGPMVALAPMDLPQPLAGSGLDSRALGFGMAAALVSALISGLAPVVRSSGPDAFIALRQGGRSAGTPASQRFLNGLAVAELALAAVLLVGAGLMLRSFAHLLEVDPGFEPQGAVTARITLPEQRYREAHQRVELFRRVRERIGTLPGVRSADAATTLPMSSVPWFGTFHIEGGAPAPPGKVLYARYSLISPGYLATMGIPVLEGRSFTAADDAKAPGVVIVSRAMALQYWPGRSPVGARLQRGQNPGPDAPWLTVVGVAADVRDAGLSAEVEPMYYFPYAQQAGTDVARTFNLVVRGSSGPEALASSLRREVWSVDRELPLYGVGELEEILAGSLSQQRFSAFLLGSFAGLSLLLVVAGVYSVMSYFVSQRDREMGIRKALGARPADLLGLVFRRGARLMFLGLGLGLAGALALARLLSSQLYQVKGADPWTLSAVAAGLAFVALAATYLPARRAARVDPAIVLKG